MSGPISLATPDGPAVGQPPVEHKQSKAEKEYEDFLYQTLGPLTLGIGILVCLLASKPFDINDEYSLPCQLAMTDQEVLTLTPPAARLLAKMNLSPKVRSAIVSSGDSYGVILVAFGYLARVYSVIQKEGLVGNVQTTRGVRTASEASNGHNAGIANSPTALDQLGIYSGFGAYGANN